MRCAILDRYGIDAAGRACAHPRSAARARRRSPATRGSRAHETRMIATPQQSLEAAAAVARAGRRHAARSSATPRRRSARGRQGAWPASRARSRATASRSRRPCVLLSGGETTVTVRGERPRRPQCRVPARARDRADGEPGVYAHRRRHRRRRRRRRRSPARSSRPTRWRARGAQGIDAARLPRRQRRPRLLRGARRLGRHRPDAHQRQRLSRDPRDARPGGAMSAEPGSSMRFGTELMRQADVLAHFTEDAPRVTRTYLSDAAQAGRRISDRAHAATPAWRADSTRSATSSAATRPPIRRRRS